MHCISSGYCFPECTVTKDRLWKWVGLATFSFESSAAKFAEVDVGLIISIMGRFNAMDRDNRWDRVESAYDLIVKGEAGYRVDSSLRGLKVAYDWGATGKFELPTAVVDGEDQSVTLDPDDPVVFMNIRADSTSKISKAITSTKFVSFDRNHDPHQGYFCSLMEYHQDFNYDLAFP